MAERAAERIAGPKPVHDLHRNRRHQAALVPRASEHALVPELDDRRPGPEVEQSLGSRVGGSVSDDDRDLLQVPDGDGRVGERPASDLACLLG